MNILQTLRTMWHGWKIKGLCSDCHKEKRVSWSSLCKSCFMKRQHHAINEYTQRELLREDTHNKKLAKAIVDEYFKRKGLS